MTAQQAEAPGLLFSEVLTLIAHHATAASELAMRFQEEGSDFNHHMERIGVLNAAIAAHLDRSESWQASENGGRQHQRITTVEQLDALPGASYDELNDAADIDGTVIKDAAGALYEKNADGTWATDGEPAAPSSKIGLPALLLWHPGQEGSGSGRDGVCA
ncbi:hypothetical protein [Mycolicibacterium sp. 120270]|uniref:hypothetical protein n=1 Tax=Mycolicibacterium sp. 120270 TaxID=3090600 RepID=UPI00299D5FD1|nr:hypothetical protein [Mycolicibacterium sp. 120270]MDX1886839.1 hypothetical protein [Mycolicibacterium sp. 120270]